MLLSVNIWAPQVAVVIKTPPAIAEAARDAGSIPGSGRTTIGGHDNPLQDSYLENPMDRGASQATSPWGCKELDMTKHTPVLFLCFSPT